MADGTLGEEGAGGLRVVAEAELTPVALGRPSDTISDAVGHVVEAVRQAQTRRTALRVVGGGRWLDAGRPVRADGKVTVGGTVTGIVEYVPGDLTLTARAGTTLGEIARATAAHGQWLTLDPFGDDDGTLGATVATASCGPLATAFGTPRDIVLGAEFVTGTAAVVRGGGRVVKNVAGFDLVRLVTGSWGTIGVLTEITVRLRARPEVDASVAVAVGTSADELAALPSRLRAFPFTPFALELVDATLAARLGVGERTCLLARLGGSEDSVRAQRAALRALGDVRDVPADVWAALRRSEPAGASCVRLSRVPSRFGETWADAARFTKAFDAALVHGAPLRGVVRCCVAPPTGDGGGGGGTGAPTFEDRLAQALTAPFDGTRIFERLPARLWAALAPSAVTDRLSQGIKAAYDPLCLLNPGILGDCAER